MLSAKVNNLFHIDKYILHFIEIILLSPSHTSALWLFKILHDRFMAFRNRVFHNESICWNKNRVTEIHNEIIEVIGCINKDMPNWLAQLDRVPAVSSDIIQIMDWKN